VARAVRILNLAKLDKKLKRLPEAAVIEIRAAMEASANEIVAMMKRLVPVGDYAGGGELRDSIGWTWGKKPKYAQALAVAKSKLGGKLTITIYAGNSRVRYAHLVEFGTAPHKIGDGQHPGAKKQPYFFVSWRALRKPAKSRINKAVRTSAKKVAASKQ